MRFETRMYLRIAPDPSLLRPNTRLGVSLLAFEGRRGGRILRVTWFLVKVLGE